MKKLLIPVLLATLTWSANAKDTYQAATQACEAYNNMKHTQNSNGITLEVGKEYRILDHNKGQILTLIKGESIPQRWVDESCFAPQSLGNQVVDALNKKRSKQNLLAISWQNAFCETHRRNKACKSMEKDDFSVSHFVLHGLWPQPRNNQYCNVDKKEVGMDKNKQWYRLSKLDLSDQTREALTEKMPGYHNNLHRHEWIKHGTCYGTDADSYYQEALALLQQVNESAIQTYFVQNQGKTVYLKDIRTHFDTAFGKGSSEHVTMNCDKGLVTELWLHLGSGSRSLTELLPKGQTPKTQCTQGKVDAFGY